MDDEREEQEHDVKNELTIELSNEDGSSLIEPVEKTPEDGFDDKNEGLPLHKLPQSAITDDQIIENDEDIALAAVSPQQDNVEVVAGESSRQSSSFRWNSPLMLVYISHGLSSWGDRMWTFTMGMLLVDWENLQSLRTVAIHQLCQAVAVFIFGALIGAWVDRTRRLRATVSSIVVQNVFVTASALVLLILLRTTQDRNPDEPPLWQHHLAIAFSIGFSTIAYLASVASHLTVQKDWVPTLCNENAAKLTATNAVLKRIDLTTAILSPPIAGLAMDLAGAWAGGVVVVVWNVISAPIEILLLYTVYRRNAMLQVPKRPSPPSSTNRPRPASSTSMASHGSSGADKRWDGTCCYKVPLMRPVITLLRGWGCYWKQVVRWSGASLAALYFTVLSFDAVTTAYIRSLCVSELVVAVAGIGSFVFGVVGTVVFLHIRNRFGLRRSGAMFYMGHVFILLVAAISVFLPGSPFGPINSPEVSTQNPLQIGSTFENQTTSPNQSPNSTINPDNDLSRNASNFTAGNFSLSNLTETSRINEPCPDGENIGGFRSVHLWVLTLSIVFSRLTLWGSDLSINQGLVEMVDPKKRGVVNGVQRSMEQLVDLIRLVTVICVPYPSQFGWLVIATFAWIVGGCAVYLVGAPSDELNLQRKKVASEKFIKKFNENSDDQL